MSKKRLFLVDGPGFYYRAFFGIKGNLKSPDGTPTNAVYGFTRMMENIRKEQPDFLVIALDSKERTFRHEMYKEYKANRQKMPEDLCVQLPIIEKVIDALNLPILKEPGLEADDLIGFAAKRAVESGFEVLIYSGDKDMMQLVGDNVKMFDPLKEKLIDASGVEEKFGVPPSGVVDMLGLMGDSSDNIPGVPGVGAKTALKLLKEYGDMENLLANACEIKQPKLKESLTKFASQARLSRRLATVKTDLDMKLDFDSWKLTKPNKAKAEKLFRELGFRSLVNESETVRAKKGRYKTVLTIKELEALAQELKKAKRFAVDAETTSMEPVKARLIGISFSYKEGEGCYIPVGHNYDGAKEQLPKSKVIEMLKPLLEDTKIEKYGQNIKYDMIVLEREGVYINPLSFDTMIASYLLNAEERRHGLSQLADRLLGYTMIEYSDVAGKGAKEISFSKVEIGRATEYAAEDADITFRLTAILKKKIKKEGFQKLYDEMELPLIKVLASMERNGIAIDAGKLERYSKELEEALGKLEKEIYKTAGEEFNIASPKQLGVILFEKLGLKVIKKTKRGPSTDQKVLETLSESHPLPLLLLRYRTLAKLNSTYVKPLPAMVSPETGRIHTSFNQAMAATGRLSSSSPNLQNIPVRTEEGRKIREAFHAVKGSLLISADYSQIELRLLAHLSGDKLLTESFNSDEDVHARTARELFGEIAGESGDMRQIAKAVNFSIIYGKTAFGLSRDLKISRSEAAGYIENYFARYSGVFDFTKSVIEEAKANGFVSTMAGRKRNLPDINSANKTMREMAERMAVNSVVQGSAADLMKKAMIDIHAAIEGSDSKMLLQVHDELIFEVPERGAAKLSALARDIMETVWKLSVPLKVQVSSSTHWGNLH